LILSQVVLSLQLPFAIIPLIHFTSDKRKMGPFASNLATKIAVWCVAAVIVALNLKLIYDELAVWLGKMPWLWLVLGPVVVVILGVIGFITFMPLFRRGGAWMKEEIDGIDKVAPNIKTMTVKHIGVALEHSEGDARIISAAMTLAKSYNAKMTLVHVVDTPGVTVYGSESQSLHSSADKAYLERLAQEIEERFLQVATDLRFGRPVDELVRSVKENGFDLLVLGSHGHRRIGDLVYGETVDSVRHAIDIPVFVVRTQAQEHPQQEH
jgi:manganese transport protein